jgi:hypothetical protein
MTATLYWRITKMPLTLSDMYKKVRRLFGGSDSTGWFEAVTLVDADGAATNLSAIGGGETLPPVPIAALQATSGSQTLFKPNNAYNTLFIYCNTTVDFAPLVFVGGGYIKVKGVRVRDFADFNLDNGLNQAYPANSVWAFDMSGFNFVTLSTNTEGNIWSGLWTTTDFSAIELWAESAVAKPIVFFDCSGTTLYNVPKHKWLSVNVTTGNVSLSFGSGARIIPAGGRWETPSIASHSAATLQGDLGSVFTFDYKVR